jgi:hypothetical protein
MSGNFSELGVLSCSYIAVQAQLLRPDWKKLTCTISDGYHMIHTILDPSSLEKFETAEGRTRPSLSGSLITCNQVQLDRLLEVVM